MARYSLIVLKVPLNTKQTMQDLSCSQHAMTPQKLTNIM